MSAPFFPPPPKKESAPYRAPAAVPLVAEVREAPRVVHRPAERVIEAPKAVAPQREIDPPSAPFLATLAWRLAAKLVALGATAGILWALVRAHDLGAKWPQAILIVLGIVGIIAAPVVLYFRVRRLIRFLFARDDDA